MQHSADWWLWIGLFLVASTAWDIYTREVSFGHYLEFDLDDAPGPFIIITGLKCVLGALILICYFFGPAVSSAP